MAYIQTCKCGSEVSQARTTLGYTTCKECGDLDAQEEIGRKRQRVGVTYNKGGLEYMGSPDQVRTILKTEGSRKHLPIGDQPSHERVPGTRSAGKPKPTLKKEWQFSHFEWPTNELGHRVKRAVLVPKSKPERKE